MDPIQTTENTKPTEEMSAEQTPDSSSTSRVPVFLQLSVAVSILVVVFGVTYISDAFPGKNSESPDWQATIPPTELTPTENGDTLEDPFENLLITARSAYVWDIKEQRAIFNKNAEEQLPLASLTKLMTTLVVHELLESDTNVLISQQALLQSGDTGLYTGEWFSLENLRDLTLMTSSNDGAYALALAAANTLPGGTAESFIQAMNIRAETLGLSRTYFKNPTGLDETEIEAGGYGSARDMAFLMEYMVTQYPEILESTRDTRAVIKNKIGEYHIAENTNQAVHDVSGLIASKTGYTDLAGGNLVVAFDAGLNRPFIISVLGSTYDERFTDTAALAAAARAYIAQSATQ